MRTLTNAEMLAALHYELARCKPRDAPPMSTAQIEAEMRLESRAEDRADVAAGVWASGRDGDAASARYFGGAP